MASGSQNNTSFQAQKWTNLRAFTIGNTAKDVDGTAAVSWSKNEILGASDSTKFYRGDKTWSNTLTNMLILDNGSVNGELLRLVGVNDKTFSFKLTSPSGQTDATNVDIGWDWAAGDGAGAAFRSALFPNQPGYFVIYARTNTTDEYTLVGKTDGTLTWTGKIIPNTGNTTGTVGGGEQPIYSNGGVLTNTSYALKATVNNGTAAHLAYYSGERAISSWSAAKFHDGCLSLFPTTSSYREGIRIHSAGSWSDITLCGNDNTGDSGTSANSWFIGNNNGNFYIARNGSPGSTAYLSCVSNVWNFLNQVTFGARVTSTAPSELTSVDRIIITPYYHTGGPWKITSKDDASNAYLSLYYSTVETARMQHNGTLLLCNNISFTNSGTSFRGINYGTMGDNDQWRIGGAATAANAGYMELATADDGNEPIYVRQYTGVFTTVKRTLTLLDANGHTSLPGNLTIDGNIAISHAVTADMAHSSANPKITFSENGTQPVHIIYCDWDSYRAPAGLKIVGGESASPAWLEVEGNVFSGGSLHTTKAGECGLEVNNTQATNPNQGAFIVGGSGNLGIYSRKHSKWVVACDASGNVSLSGNAATATKFNSNRTIKLTGSVTGSATTNGESGWEIATTTNHNHDWRYPQNHITSFAFTGNNRPLSRYVTFDLNAPAGGPGGWINGFMSVHNDYLASYIVQEHRTDNWYLGWNQYSTGDSTVSTAPVWREIIHSGNIGSQSVNYATSAGNSATTSKLLDSAHSWTATEVYNYMTARVLKAGDTMTGQLYINYNQDVGLNQNGSLIIGTKGGENIGIDGNEIMARNNGAASTLYINSEGGNVQIGGGGISSTGTIASTAGYLKSTANGNTLTMGSQNASWCHFVSGVKFHFGQAIWAVDGFHVTNGGGSDLGANYTKTECTVNNTNGKIGLNSSTNRGLYEYTDSKWIIYLQHSDDTVRSSYKIYGAVWNDYAEFREGDVIEGGYTVYDDGYGRMKLCTQRMQPGSRVTSDTYGIAVGHTNTAKTPIGVSGRVLAYPAQPRNNYKVGDAVCSAPGGKIDIMTRDEIQQYPDRIIGIVSEVPDYDIWDMSYKAEEEKEAIHTNIKVNGRIWIYVK